MKKISGKKRADAYKKIPMVLGRLVLDLRKPFLPGRRNLEEYLIDRRNDTENDPGYTTSSSDY